MKVVFIENEDINRDSSGGVMSYILNLSSFLREEGWESILIATGDISKNAAPVRSELSKCYSVSTLSGISNFNFFKKLFTSESLKKISQKDIIHVQRPEMVIPIYLRRKNKIVCTLHGGQDIAVRKKKGRAAYWLYSLCQTVSFLLVDQIIVVDRKNLDRYIKKYPWIKGKVSLIPISIDTTRFYPLDKLELRRKYGFPLEDNILLYVGRLEYEKNVDFLVDSFLKINDENTKLLVAGDGSLRLTLESKAKLRSQKITFLGEVKNTHIPEIINLADAVALCSYFEGSPTVVKESLCCKVPVISTDVGDVKEVLMTVKGGEIIELTENDLFRAFNKVLNMNETITDDVSKLFGLAAMGEKTLTIYSKC